MELQFSSDYNAIIAKIDQIDPVKYGKTRNYVNGDVTYLSPFISRGVISTRQILENVMARGFKISQIGHFIKELCWRDYFQRLGQVKDLNIEIKQMQFPVLNYEISSEIVNANTEILGIDQAIKQLYRTGYMHNHCRMYTASLVCNIAKSHWLLPAKWMYFHLLDGDWASNACSWQWVAGANSSKKYFANQENINKYTNTNQTNTFLDISYEAIEQMETPKQLLALQNITLETTLPQADLIQFDINLPVFIYNYYNLDPMWHKGEAGNRILLLEPEFFSAYPVSNNCIEFLLATGKNVANLQIYVGSFESFCKQYSSENIYFKEHPLNMGYKGIEDQRDWIADTVVGYHSSFFSYWKKVEKELFLKYR